MLERKSMDGGDMAAMAVQLCTASRGGDTAAIEILLAAQVDPSALDPTAAAAGETALHAASRGCHAKALEGLIGAAANVDQLDWNGRTAADAALQSGSLHCLAALVEGGADVDLRGPFVTETLLWSAAQRGLLQAVRLLAAAQSVDANARQETHNGETALHAASSRGHCVVVDVLLDEACPDLNQLDDKGATPLFEASKNGYHEVVHSLIRAGADVDMQNENGGTALYIACQNGHALVVNQLLAAQASTSLCSKFGAGPLHIASQNGYTRIVESLLSAGGADPNALTGRGVTALFLASQMGHRGVAKCLIERQADVNCGRESPPIVAATLMGHFDIARLLIQSGAILDAQCDRHHGTLPLLCMSGNTDLAVILVEKLMASRQPSDPPLSDTFMYILNTFIAPDSNSVLNELAHPQTQSGVAVEQSAVGTEDTEKDNSNASADSDRLHRALNRSGFVHCRATLQSAAADALQRILRMRSRDPGLCVVGSFSEGWGNNLTRLDGKTDVESDIDVTQLLEGRLYHVRGQCHCKGIATEDMVEYDNGHIYCAGFASTPARPESGTAIRPAIDRVDACRLCCYPPITPLLPDRIHKSHIPSAVLEALKNEVATSPCHVVHASAPKQQGKQLRVSTTFLEKLLLRNLSSIQGQLFISLKYLVKKVIGPQVRGLKAYHAKTVTFRLVEETPDQEWQPGNLLHFVRRALEMLWDTIEAHSGRPEDPVMDHYFLSGASLYLKGDDCSDTKEIAAVIDDTIANLHKLALSFEATLQPLESSGRFYFHPFLITPVLDPQPASFAVCIEYHEIYDIVRESLLKLAQEGEDSSSSEFFRSLTEMISRLPDCARSAREALTALAYLKLGWRQSAVEALVVGCPFEPSQGIDWPSDDDSLQAEATEQCVWNYLTTNDSAWKFCFIFLQPLKLSFLPEFFQNCFPSVLENYHNYFYINFDALLKCLQLEFLGVDMMRSHEWFDDVAQRSDSDVQELQMTLHYCQDTELRKALISKLHLLASRDAPTLELAHRITQDDMQQGMARMQSLATKAAQLVAELPKRPNNSEAISGATKAALGGATNDALGEATS